ncbi:AvrD family protein [Actinacidiphila sp. ITFR-21]|uniref:AvrD family protein n=1 Tax=Actinacidiphila sp. ITFR-21 TaxID=3075199 RepID=UPI00288A89E3|nr:AvrD family protein [Streptomyces sp. ITFR-21]WNI17845.1 AvrD family protein [Streptomyces sp. ITFR-21]
MTTTGRQLRLDTIDEYLGPGETRFFSRGYQRARYDVRDVRVRPALAEGICVTATADISYPADWSRKRASVDLPPHLSTVDALVLGVQLAESHLVHAHRLAGADRRAVRLRKVALRAGNAPQEELADLPLSAALVRSGADALAEGGNRSVYDCTVGGLRVRCEIEHPTARGGAADTGPATRRHDSLADVLGAAESRFYGEGFQRRRHSIHNVRVDVDTLTAEADARFADDAGKPVPAEGIEGLVQPAVSAVDAFVVNLQLAQVLMYELDSLTRESSNTLWMMQTVLEAPYGHRALPRPEESLPTRTGITGHRLLPLRGGAWRSVDLRGGLADISMRAAFAHELPEDAAAAARRSA